MPPKSRPTSLRTRHLIESIPSESSPVVELFCDFYRCADRRVLVKCSRHSFWQANTTVRSSKRWYIALMHCVTASEEHGVGHLGAVEMATRRAFIFPGVNI